MRDGNGKLRSGGTTGRPAVVRRALFAVVVIVLVLRHDYWWWEDARPLLFGFLPVGLWWQALVTLLAAGMMWMLVKFAWPGHLEEEAEGKKVMNEE